MSLLAFVEFGGEAIVRGMLTGGPLRFALDSPVMGPVAEAALNTEFARRGYDRFNLTAAEKRQLLNRAASSVRAANRINDGESPLSFQGSIPSFPAQNVTGTFTHLVEVELLHPDGTRSKIVVDVVAGRPMGRAEATAAALGNLEQRLNIRSDPKGRGQQGSTVESTRIISVYQGEVMQP